LIKATVTMATFMYVRNTMDITYSNPHCALRVVNETDPVAFSKHPYWKDLTYDESCSGSLLEKWVNNQMKGGATNERFYMEFFLYFFTFVLAPALLLKALYDSFAASDLFSNIPSKLWKGGWSALFGLFAASIMLMHTHFAIDILYLCGGIYHHAMASQPGIDDKNGSVSEGYVIAGTWNRLFYNVAIFLMIKSSKRLSECFNPYVVLALANVQMFMAVRQVGRMHPVYHDMARNGITPELQYALPYTSAWRAYKHCITHHDNGLSFSGDLFLDPLWDGFLLAFAYVHNSILHITAGSNAHFLASTIADGAMGMMGTGVMYFILSLFSRFIPASASAEAVAASGKKKAN